MPRPSVIGLVGLPPLQGHDVGGGAAEVGPVAHRVLDEGLRLRDPHRARASGEPAREDDAGDLAALAGPGAVAEEVALPVGDPARGAIALGGGLDLAPVVRDGEPARQVGGVGGLRHDDRLELGGRQRAACDDGRGQGWGTPFHERRRGRRHRGHGHALDEGRGVRHRAHDLDPLRRVAGVDLRDRLVGARGGVDREGDRSRRARPGRGGLAGRGPQALRGNGHRACGHGHGRGGERHPRRTLGQAGADGVQRGLQPVHRLGKDRPRVRRPAVVEAIGDEQRRLHARAHPGEDPAGQDEVEAWRDEPHQARPEGGLARRTGRERQDRHEAPAECEAPGCRERVAQRDRRVSLARGRGREGRVHQDHVRERAAMQQVVDVLGVVPGGRGVEHLPKERGPERVDLVQDDVPACELRHVRQRPGAGRGLQHHVARADRGRAGRDMSIG